MIRLVSPAGESARLRTLALLLPGLAGVAMIAWRQLTADQTGTYGSDLALLLGASLSWALGSVLSERRASKETSSIAVSGMALIIGGAALLGISAAAGEFYRFKLAELSMNSALAWAYLTVAGTVVAFGAYVWLLERVSPTFVATYTFVNPIIAVALGWAVLSEPLDAAMLFGGALVVASIVGLLVFDPPPTKKDVANVGLQVVAQAENARSSRSTNSANLR